MIQRYIPTGARKVADKSSTAVAYLHERAGWFIAAAYHGKATKADWNFRFKTESARSNHVAAHFKKWQEIEARQAARAAERKAFKHDFKVGDVFRCSWGYDQTNVDFYQVQEVRGSMLIVCEIEAESVACEKMGDRGQCAPSVDSFKGEPFRVKAQKDGFRVDGYRFACLVSPQLVAGVKVYPSSYWSAYA
jgi:hypothetical protein